MLPLIRLEIASQLTDFFIISQRVEELFNPETVTHIITNRNLTSEQKLHIQQQFLRKPPPQHQPLFPPSSASYSSSLSSSAPHLGQTHSYYQNSSPHIPTPFTNSLQPSAHPFASASPLSCNGSLSSASYPTSSSLNQYAVHSHHLSTVGTNSSSAGTVNIFFLLCHYFQFCLLIVVITGHGNVNGDINTSNFIEQLRSVPQKRRESSIPMVFPSRSLNFVIFFSSFALCLVQATTPMGNMLYPEQKHRQQQNELTDEDFMAIAYRLGKKIYHIDSILSSVLLN